MLFGAVALTGVLASVSMQTLTGPVTTITRVTQRNIAENHLLMNSKILINAAVAGTSGGDVDDDGIIEPAPFVPAGGGETPPTNGGFLPADLGLSQTDPWGSRYGYCVWDHGADNNSTNRITGDNTASAPTQPVIAVIGAGPDKVFQTTCAAYSGGQVQVTKSGGSDDIVFQYTYAEASASSNGLWTLNTSDESKAELKDSAGTANVTIDRSTGIGDFLGLTTSVISAKIDDTIALIGGLLLDDAASNCGADQKGAMRLSADGASIELCDGAGGWERASAQPGGDAGHVQFNDGAGGFGGDANLFWDNATKRLGIGTASPETMLNVHGGTILLSSANPAYRSEIINAENTARSFAITQEGYDILSSAGGGGYGGITLGNSGRTFTIARSPQPVARFSGLNVGIDTAAPSHKLDVLGGANFGDTSTTNGYVEVQGLNETTPSVSVAGGSVSTAVYPYGVVGSRTGVEYSNALVGGSINFKVSGTVARDTIAATIQSTGRVGVGTVTPGYLLDVDGTMGVSGAATLSDTLSVAGNAAFDTNTLFVDALSNTVGIGTSAPGARLDVAGAIKIGAQSACDTGGANNGTIRFDSTLKKMQICVDGAWGSVSSIENLDDIGDVDVPTPDNNHVLAWNAADSKWESKNIAMLGPAAVDPAGNEGSVQFREGSDLGADPAHFHWDKVNHRLGIGTATPGAKLHVYGAGNNGGAALFEAGSWNSVTIKGVNGAGVQDSAFLKFEDASGENTFIGLTGTAGANGGNVGDLRLGVSGERVRISKTTGYVGIGNVPLPRARLHVNGGIKLGDDADVCPGGSNIKLGTLKYVSDTLSVCNTTGWTAIDAGGIGGVTPAGNDGSIQFKSGSDLAADAANLHWDDTNKRLGIGTATPSVNLHVIGTAIIDTASTVDTALTVRSGDPLAFINIKDDTQTASTGIGGRGNRLELWTDGNAKVHVNEVGNVGIGTATPRSLLQVAGGIQLADDAGACPGGSNIKVGTLKYVSDVLSVCNTAGWTAIDAGGIGGVTPAGNDGSIQFKSGSNLAADAANLHWDDANNRLGIGTASPYARLSVASATETVQTFTNAAATSNGTWSLAIGSNSQLGHGQLAIGIGSAYSNANASVRLGSGHLLIGNTTTATLGAAFPMSLQIRPNLPVATGGFGVHIHTNNAGNLVPVSGNTETLVVGLNFSPTSGTATYTDLSLRPTINQTGGANGITRALLIQPVLTSAANFRGVELANNIGFGLYQSGSGAANYFAGNLGIGTTSPASKLHVVGGIQLGDDADVCPGASNVKVGTLRYNGGALQICGTGGWAGVSGSGGTLTDGDKTDITVSGTGTVWTIDNNAVTTAKIANSNVTNAKLANMAANTIKGNNTGSAAAPLDLTVAQLATMLDGTGTFVLKAGDTMTGRLVNTGALTASQGMATATSNLGAFEARSQGSAGTAGAAFITFHRPSNQAVYFGLDTDNQLKVGGWSMGANAYKLWHENNDGSGSTLDADLLDGMNALSTATANTVVARDTNGDTTVRYLMSTYLNMSHAQATRNADTIFYSSTDNYLRKNNASGFRTSLDVYSKGEVDALAGSVTDGDKGDITVSGTGAIWTIDAGAVNSAKILDGAIATADLANSNVTYAKIQNVSATSRLLGRASAGAGIIEELTVGSGLSLVGTTLTATGGGADNLGNHTATQDLNMTGSYKITFGAASPLPADLLHLWSNTYGIGIETATLTNWSGSQFRWRIGGASVSAGTERMLLTASGLTVNGAFSATSLSGSGASLTNLNASNLASGTVAAARLGSGTANSSVFLRGDGTWAAPPSGADNLGNHAATQNLNLNGYHLTGVRQIIGGFGVTTTGTAGWNDASNARSGNGMELLLGTASNGPGPSTYFYPFSFEYPTMNGTGQITQFAIPYSASAHLDSGLFIRGRYTGTWSGWRKILTENTSGAVSISGTMTANAFSGSGASLTSLNASNLASGTVAPARLGTGTANSSTYLRGDGTWAAAAGDNLGNHTATTTLNVNSQLMAGVAQITGSAWHANYDVWLQGGVNGASGSARKLALLGYKVSDHLYVNYGSEYAGGTIIGGPVGITYAPSYTLDVQSGTVRATAYLYTSDARLKKDVRTLSGLDIVTRLRGVSFKWKDSGKAATGVIAQEIEAVLPTAVSTDKSGIKSVDYQQLTGPLIEAIKELKADNDNLRAANDNQSVAIDSLRAEVEALKRLTGGAR